MTLDTILEIAQRADVLVDAPWGPIISRICGDVRGDLPRFEKDLPVIIAFINDVIPVVQKHWPTVGPAINDLLPLIQQIARDAKA